MRYKYEWNITQLLKVQSTGKLMEQEKNIFRELVCTHKDKYVMYSFICGSYLLHLQQAIHTTIEDRHKVNAWGNRNWITIGM